MSKGGYTIRQLEAADCSLLVPLMKNCFGMDVHDDYFKWKYFDNPLGNCVGFIAVEKDTHTGVSFYGAIPQKYIVDGTERIIYQACDTMTHTSHRKKGLYPVLAKECYTYLKAQQNFFLIGIGGTAQSFPVLKHFGWKTIFNFRNYFKPGPFCWFSLLKRYPANDFNEETSLELLQDITKEQNPSPGIRSPWDIVHYKWRISNPNFDYKVVSYKKKDEIRGFVVYYVQGNKILLFDFAFKDKNSRKALLWYLSRIVVKNKYKGIIAFCQERSFQSHVLRKGSFIANPFKKGPLAERPPFLVYSDEETMEKYAAPAKWNIRAYDYDAF